MMQFGLGIFMLIAILAFLTLYTFRMQGKFFLPLMVLFMIFAVTFNIFVFQEFLAQFIPEYQIHLN